MASLRFRMIDENTVAVASLTSNVSFTCMYNVHINPYGMTIGNSEKQFNLNTNNLGGVEAFFFVKNPKTSDRNCFQTIYITRYNNLWQLVGNISRYNYRYHFTLNTGDIIVIDGDDLNAMISSFYTHSTTSDNAQRVAIPGFNINNLQSLYITTPAKLNLQSNGVVTDYNGKTVGKLTLNPGSFGDEPYTKITITPPEIYFAESTTTENILHVPMTESQGQVITGESDSVSIPDSALFEVAKATPPPEITVKYTGTSVPTVTDTPVKRSRKRVK